MKCLPPGKSVVLGVVTTKDSKPEDKAELKARVLDAATQIAEAQGKTKRKALDDNLAISPQCGFASGAESKGVDMSIEAQWKKLELLRDVASELWPQDTQLTG